MLNLGRHSVRRKALHALTRSPGTRPASSLKHDLLDDLKDRGLAANITSSQALRTEIVRGKQVAYSGIDPTARSLHVGHLVPLMCLLHFQLHGHRVISVIGGATGLVGDPSGRSTERELAEEDQIEYNVARLTTSVERFFNNAQQHARERVDDLDAKNVKVYPLQVLNNMAWHKGVGFLEFLRDVGVHARVNTMIARDSVKSRLDSQQGISFTEFSYQLLQAYDFYHLHQHASCTIQIGGSDQWGNIVAGIDLISRRTATEPERRKRLHREAHGSPEPEPTDEDPDRPVSVKRGQRGFGITTPLLTTASGEKFGKSAGNAVWLDEQLTSVFDFYQYFFRMNDVEVERSLKMFTLLSTTRIADEMDRHLKVPEKRGAQRLLADEVTLLVHGQDGLRRARAGAAALFTPDLDNIVVDDLIDALEGDRRLHRVHGHEIIDIPIIKLVTSYKLMSGGAARRTLQQGGLYLNNKRVLDETVMLTAKDFIGGRVAIIRAGKDNHIVLALQ